MSNTLYLLHYNNYNDRIFKKEDYLSDYLPYEIAHYTGINFNPNDGLVASQVININLDEVPDYILAVDEANNIVSRWFVIEAVRVRGGQYRYELYRDVIADFTDTVLSSPCFIEKAIIPDNDSAIFNPEDMTFNQIKTAETPLKDATGVSWLVAYVASKNAQDQVPALDVTILPEGEADLTIATLEDLNLPLENAVYGNARQLTLGLKCYSNRTVVQPLIYKQSNSSTLGISYNTSVVNTQDNTINLNNFSYTTSAQFDALFADTYDTIIDKVPIVAGYTLQGQEYINNLLRYDNSTVYVSTEQHKYRITIETNNVLKSSPYDAAVVDSEQLTLFNILDEQWGLIGNTPAQNPVRGKWYRWAFAMTEYRVVLTDLGAVNTELNFNLPVARTHLLDAPYDMICAPYENLYIRDSSSSSFQSYGDIVNQVFKEIAINYCGGENPTVYDIQRLPYCPIPLLETHEGTLDATVWNDATQLFYIKQGTTNVGAVFACQYSNFSRDIPLANPIGITNTKIQAMCDTYRICSPNYNGVFELNVAMNGGLTGFTSYCSYKPYNPYIQVTPIFGRMYGQDFADARGLICGGEWSMPIVTSAWETYERQNANYQNIFARQIENMEVQHGVARTQEVWSIIAGSLQGAATGGGAGMLLNLGGPASIGIGAAAGALSAGAGLIDRHLNDLLRHEAIDFAQDQFGYQLGNIKALPTSLARTSAFTVNNKVFPFLEYYTCTPEEKEALAYKVAHNGMTYMRIGTINEFIDNTWSYEGITARNYIKGKIIKCEDLNEDYHIAKRIAYELNNGIYFGGN